MPCAVPAPGLCRTLRLREQPPLGFGRVEALQGRSAKVADSPPSQSSKPLTADPEHFGDIVLALEKLPPSVHQLSILDSVPKGVASVCPGQSP